MRRLSICMSLLLLAAPAHSASVFRCIDEQGHVTFSQQGCPSEQNQQRQQAANPTPSSGKAVPMAKPKPARSGKRKEEDSLTVVAEQDDGCGNQVTGRERRSAIISQNIRAGMTRRDVESALGRPEQITSSNGRTRLRFRDTGGQVRTVSFDENGCVQGKR
ncbi:hypothetical protein CXK94_20815 [Stutzerimonas stutzeri]|uniref:DUF4124 domain-containing protein n=1 Tax=Stutzerimonas stutzeri TaxID=316 RepID=A0A2N8SRP8_STUST|nr:DUF4124 domain-containing protein [Stutzerimonas stutzeri]MCQ4326266.1 DUF4124 domain-containing protein [Stutzerimonas stutzeri]PNG05161.1 hypothetical protein CXK94_20815 [Stutzerimonas stutzeri]